MEWTALLQCDELTGRRRAAGPAGSGAAEAGPRPALPLTDDEAFYEGWLLPLEERMLRSAWRILRDPELARDAVQDALAVIWARRERVRAHPNPRALVLRICIDAALDARRRERRTLRTASALAFSSPARFDEGPAWIAERHERRDKVLDAIGRLPGRQAAAVLLRYLHDADYRTIAQALECSEVTARIHVMRGRARLGRWLSELAPAAAGSGP